MEIRIGDGESKRLYSDLQISHRHALGTLH
jgi:hypothetical protein